MSAERFEAAFAKHSIVGRRRVALVCVVVGAAFALWIGWLILSGVAHDNRVKAQEAKADAGAAAWVDAAWARAGLKSPPAPAK